MLTPRRRPPCPRLQCLKLNDQIQQMAEELKDEQSCLVFGRGRNYASAMEAALKVRRAAELSACMGPSIISSAWIHQLHG